MSCRFSRGAGKLRTSEAEPVIHAKNGTRANTTEIRVDPMRRRGDKLWSEVALTGLMTFLPKVLQEDPLQNWFGVRTKLFPDLKENCRSRARADTIFGRRWPARAMSEQA
jgi:hypothetical protein